MASVTTLLNQLDNNLSETEFTRSERRELGLTPLNIFRTAKALKKKGLLSGNRKTAAKQIATTIRSKNERAFDKPGVDWDSILAFIEKLLPIILQLLAIFGV